MSATPSLTGAVTLSSVRIMKIYWQTVKNSEANAFPTYPSNTMAFQLKFTSILPRMSRQCMQTDKGRNEPIYEEFENWTKIGVFSHFIFFNCVQLEEDCERMVYAHDGIKTGSRTFRKLLSPKISSIVRMI